MITVTGIRTSRRLRGMTLLEVLAVVVILGMLAVTLTVGLSGKIGRAKREIARTQISQIVTQIQSFQLAKQVLPTPGEGLRILTLDPRSAWYLEPEKLIDPWGNSYQYVVPGPGAQPYEVITLGADNRTGGSNDDADLSSADLSR